MDSFYVTLPSNVRSEFFNNTIANFKTKLAENIELKNNYIVGLSSISYTKSWLTLPTNEYIKFYYFKGKQIKLKQEAKVLKGLYLDVTAFLVAINDAIISCEEEANKLENKKLRHYLETKSKTHSDLKQSDYGIGIKYKSQPNYTEFGEKSYKDDIGINYKFFYPEKNLYDYTSLTENQLKEYTIALPKMQQFSRTKQIYIENPKYRKSTVLMEMPYTICRMLGFDKFNLDDRLQEYMIKNQKDYDLKTELEKKTFEPSELKIIWSKTPADLHASIHSLFIYCDIIKPNYVGNSYTQLLRVVEIPNFDFGKQVILNYPDCQYHNISCRDFNSIEIDIRDDTGNQVPFMFGRVIVVLHFKKL